MTDNTMNTPLQKITALFPPELHNQLFLVGGSVRDSLMNLPSKDIDLLATLPEDILKQQGFRMVCGKTTEPIWFRHDPDLGNMELTRLDSVEGLAANLAQRDFTINAMAMGLDGQLIDPLNARQDLQKRMLKTCSDTVFHDDPLRIIRACRFTTDNWQINSETERLIRSQDWSCQLAALPVERFSREMVKALGGSVPWRFFELLVSLDCGRHWLPELFRMPDIPAGPLQHHPEGDLLTHSLQVLQRAAEVSSDPLTRFCAFFHDIGKLSSDPAHYPKHHGHDEAGYTPAILLCERLALPASWGRALAWVSRLHTNLNRWSELRDGTKLRIAGQAEQAGIVDIVPIVSVADKPGNVAPVEWSLAVRIATMNCDQLGIADEHIRSIPLAQRSALVLQKKIEYYRSSLDLLSAHTHWEVAMFPLEFCMNQTLTRSQDAILIADLKGIIRFWNAGAERILGYAADEAIGCSLDLFIPEKLRPRHWEGYNRVMAAGETKYKTGLLSSPGIRKDGSQVSLEFSMVLLKDEEGIMHGCASIMRDVTERWLKEKELKQRLAVLEKQVDSSAIKTT